MNEYYQDYDIQITHALLVVAIPETEAEVFWFAQTAVENYWHEWEQRAAEYWRSRQM